MPPITLRAFDPAEDLDLEFASADRPALVTALLARCGGLDDDAPLWGLPVAVRIGALVEVLARTEGTDALALTVRCAHPACGESAELALAYDALRELAADAAAVPTTSVARGDAAPLVLRRPTGDDQRAWRARRFASAAEALETMVATLAVGPATAPADATPGGPTIADASEAMAEFDPLVAFRVDFACPACGTAHETPVDLEALLLERLARRQRALVRDVHRLASRYGWTEPQVLAIPSARRARYLALVDDLPEPRP